MNIKHVVSLSVAMLFCTGVSATYAENFLNTAPAETRELEWSVDSQCSPYFTDITPQKHSDIGGVETLSFQLENNANPDSVSVQINDQELDFDLIENKAMPGKNPTFSGSVDVKNAPDGKHIVNLYAESNTAIECSFRNEIYVLSKNQDTQNNNRNNYNDNDGDEEKDPLLELFKKGDGSFIFPEKKITTEISAPVITFPSLDATIFTVDASLKSQKISGTAPQGAKKIWIDFSDEHGNTEHYFLRKFSEGDTTWKYAASSHYNNLSYGLNTYTVYAEYEGKKGGEFSESQTIILFHPSPDFTPEFVDTQTHWARESIHFLKKKGIVRGRGDHNQFFPDSAITKAESAKISTLAFNVKKHAFDPENSSFVDVQGEDWFADYAQTASSENIFTAVSSEKKKFSPHSTLVESDAHAAISAASGKKFPGGFATSSSEVTRAEFSDQVVKLMQ